MSKPTENPEGSPTASLFDLLTLEPENRQSLLVDTFQCPGCTCGLNTSSKCYKPENYEGNLACQVHCSGTVLGGIGHINLGLPKGFNRRGPIDIGSFPNNIRIFETGFPVYDNFNIPFWALEHTHEFDPLDIPCPQCDAPAHSECKPGMRDSGKNHAVRSGKIEVLLVSSFCPRINLQFIDIMPGKKISDLPAPYNTTVVDVSKLDLSECR